ncbi:uncharacterized protein LOC122615685 [Drosophila teissieri]|uniref:uncharacterized protein LOC122615685 n=1 Tax=Drosophila teissieri TaxID=7243 RepID=UPI001CBA4E3E|nr:uncharacterized protein LOC122615685 [Drosophila teissieri]XP_043646667.1 uncharacterized protein LOC122615685 [Drosophila teissieri]XP_043646668.1 uncharacterized protein LOC122615685 [Drosophila teissieri]
MKVVCLVFEFLTVVQLLVEAQSGYVQEAKREIWDAMAHHSRHQHHHGSSHWVDGRRVHRMRLPHPQRWSGRRRSLHHHHQPFSRWSQWSPCDEECVRRRERYCKVKRKCGHTKHVEQSKCSHCHPAPAIKWQTPVILDDSHIRERNPPLPQPQPQPQPQPPPPPSIIINAAAAASSGPTVDYRHTEYKPPPNYAPLYPSTHPPIYAPTYPAAQPPTHPPTYPPTHPQTPPTNPKEVVRHLPKYPGQDIFSDEDVEDEPEPEADEDLISSDEQGDFFVLKHHRHRRRKNQGRPSHRKPPKEEDYDDEDFVDFGERKSLRHKHLGDDTSVEGDVFQYEDFDMPDTMYEDSGESEGEFRNISWVQPAKDGIALRRRRVYSKWSRWTKCSPKCTTRRYKKCRIIDQCGREVLREIAYCYTEGSFCQQWLQTQFQKTPAFETRPGPGSPANAMRRMQSEQPERSMNDLNYIMTGKGYRGPEYTPLKLSCGIVRSGTGRRSMSNMLKIIGGRAARKGEWPWQVAILNRFKEAFCGGTLIAPRWVLTAAHCVRKVLFVRIGEHNLNYEDGTEIQLRVMKSYTHPNFDKRTVDSDVALLRLPKVVNATTWIGYSCLPQPFQALPKNVDCTIIGWGKRRNRDATGTSVLHKATVPIIPMQNCRKVYYDYTITKNMFCAGHQKGHIDTCAGDSGGPLLCRDTTKPNHPWTIFGITSFGDGCAQRNKFGIYAKVPNYVDWVWSVVNCDGNCKMH